MVNAIVGATVYNDPALVIVTVFTPPFVVAKVAVAVATLDGFHTTLRFTDPASYSLPSLSIVTVLIPSLLTVTFLRE